MRSISNQLVWILLVVSPNNYIFVIFDRFLRLLLNWRLSVCKMRTKIPSSLVCLPVITHSGLPSHVSSSEVKVLLWIWFFIFSLLSVPIFQISFELIFFLVFFRAVKEGRALNKAPYRSSVEFYHVLHSPKPHAAHTHTHTNLGCPKVSQWMILLYKKWWKHCIYFLLCSLFMMFCSPEVQFRGLWWPHTAGPTALFIFTLFEGKDPGSDIRYKLKCCFFCFVKFIIPF